MIIVVADDFTGAAELAGIALRYGLSLKICGVNEIEATCSNENGCIVNTNSRSLEKKLALAQTKKTIAAIMQYQPTLLYKKIDSVLRGYVVDELKVQMELMGKSTALVVPSNPSLGRTIKEGIMYIQDIPVAATDFCNDPEFPIAESHVVAILNDSSVHVIESNTTATVGISVASIKTAVDIANFANQAHDTQVLAGAGDFFTALLATKYPTINTQAPLLLSPFLFVAGSAFSEARERIKLWKQKAIAVSSLGDFFECITISKDKYVLAIKENLATISASELRIAMAKQVQKLMVTFDIKEIFIEGGSTAASVLEVCGITTLTPTHELARGLVRMHAADLFITVKPGSYPLPSHLIQL
jgi:uncharacterized protein YgbK (DUF1537 family)